MCKLVLVFVGVVLSGCSVDVRGLRVVVVNGSVGDGAVVDGEDLSRRDLARADREVLSQESRDVLHADVLRDDVLFADARHEDASFDDAPSTDVFGSDVLLADAAQVDTASADVSFAEVLREDVRRVDAPQVDVPQADVRRADVLQASLEDAVIGYSSRGVLVYLGVNPCSSGGWDSSTGKCYPPSAYKVTSGVCGATPSCGAHAAGTVLLWDSTLDRYRYLADPSGGTVCLPNDAVYVVSC